MMELNRAMQQYYYPAFDRHMNDRMYIDKLPKMIFFLFLLQLVEGLMTVAFDVLRWVCI
jgi:hypothetical protein